VLASDPDTIPLRGPTDGEVKAGYFEADLNGPVADDGEFRGPEGCALVGRVATGGGANAYMAQLSSLDLLLGSYQTTTVIRTAANVEFRSEIGNTLRGRFVAGDPAQALDWDITSAGLRWYEASYAEPVFAARRMVAVTASTATYNAVDGEVITADGDIVTTGVQLPDAIADTWEVTVIVPAGSATDILPASGNKIMDGSVDSAYTQAGGARALYRSDGNGTVLRLIFA
jgi:hypothetical protein